MTPLYQRIRDVRGRDAEGPRNYSVPLGHGSGAEENPVRAIGCEGLLDDCLTKASDCFRCTVRGSYRISDTRR